jgi:crossover junction endodeoxyribonuclease RusA
MKFTVYVRPQPQGSARAFVRNGHAAVTSANAKLKPYRHTVTAVVRQACLDEGLSLPLAPKHVPVGVGMEFFFERPASIPKKRVEMVVKPDLDKLIRATLDSLTGVLFHDDAQVVALTPHPTKQYGSPERVEITITAL